jgi:hypothetical protein
MRICPLLYDLESIMGDRTWSRPVFTSDNMTCDVRLSSSSDDDDESHNEKSSHDAGELFYEGESLDGKPPALEPATEKGPSSQMLLSSSEEEDEIVVVTAKASSAESTTAQQAAQSTDARPPNKASVACCRQSTSPLSVRSKKSSST